MSNDAENTQLATAQSPAVKSQGMLRLAVVLLLVMLAGAAVVIWRLHGQKEASAAAPQKPKVERVLHLESFVVNLSDAGENRFLRAGIDLGLEGKAAKGGEGEAQAFETARARDVILDVLARCSSAQLLEPDGKTRLKQQLTRELREHVPELGVGDVYFNDFLVQR